MDAPTIRDLLRLCSKVFLAPNIARNCDIQPSLHFITIFTSYLQHIYNIFTTYLQHINLRYHLPLHTYSIQELPHNFSVHMRGHDIHTSKQLLLSECT